jgi:large subunit ribosomal protein L24
MATLTVKKIKKGDTVIVITGKDQGRRGEVKRCVRLGYVIVDGVNLVKKHVRGNPQRNIESRIVEKELPIHVSNLALYNPVTQKKDKIGFKILEDGRKVRYFKSNNEIIDL